jgi:hypothetical protein
MSLLGKGVLAIWNGIAPEAEEDFVAWHVREHIPERVALPGFLRSEQTRAHAERSVTAWLGRSRRPMSSGVRGAEPARPLQTQRPQG